MPVSILETYKAMSMLFSFSGFCASILVFIAFGVTQAKDGPFLRPHPGKYMHQSCNRIFEGRNFCVPNKMVVNV